MKKSEEYFDINELGFSKVKSEYIVFVKNPEVIFTQMYTFKTKAKLIGFIKRFVK